jgi:hypothetical protein
LSEGRLGAEGFNAEGAVVLDPPSEPNTIFILGSAALLAVVYALSYFD